MMKKVGKSSFRDKVLGNVKKQKTQSKQYGYLALPKGVNVFKETPGSRVRLDFLPYTVVDYKHPDRDDELGIAVPGSLWYKRPFKLHRGIGVNRESIVCPTSIGKRCPICEYRQKLIKEGANWQDDNVKALRPLSRNLYIVIPLDSPDYDKKPYVWDISQYLFQDKLNAELEENEEYGLFPDLKEGYTLRVRFSEEAIGKNTFADTSRIDFEERDHEYDESILEKAPNLDEVLVILPYDQIEAKFFEMEDAGVPAPVEDVHEPEDEPEEELEEEVVVRKSKKIIKAEPEEEEEPEEEVVVRKSRNVEPVVERRTQTHKKRAGKECPQGYVFGKDCEEHDECEECDLWEDCIKEQEKLGNEKED